MSPYSLDRQMKRQHLLKEFSALTRHHLDHCADYARLFERLALPKPPYKEVADVPYLPVELFKSCELLSIPKEELFKTLLSSGTSSSRPSRIYLDRATAQQQSSVLASLLADFIGSERLPLLIVDTEEVIRDRTLFSARGAALAGLLPFGVDPLYLLNADLSVRSEAFDAWRRRHAEEPWLIFGFTFMLWQYLKGEFSHPHSIVLHGGGWKRLADQGISNADFKAHLKSCFGIERCYNFYGMVEQTGSIYMECGEGHFHASDYSEVIIRDPETLVEAKKEEIGVVQSLSLLPKSYPGHSLLTEDLGYEVGVDQCPCGRKGKTFQLMGRVPQVEPRGCSDVRGL